ncbi:TSUP family transporter [Lacibacter sp. H407]|uniref:TSUP family transporter n=1 Tax=Lacibacter sp. H407 TaxID=3133423 RepID=UPI0030BB0FD3
METRTEADKKNRLYPVFLKLEELRILLVGARNVGLEKLHSLLANSPEASITIVAPVVKDEVRKLVFKHPASVIVQREFEAADLENKDIVILATDNRKLHEEIRLLAKEKGLLVNVADTPDLCDFYLGSIVQKGNLKVAISTNGKSPTVAKRIKEVLNDALPGELDEVIENLHHVRNKLNGNFEYKVKKLNSITKVLVEKDRVGTERQWKKIATYSLIAFAFMLIGHFIFSYIPFGQIATDTVAWYKTLDKNFHWLVLAGFLAQLVDGALGMGYGVTSATVLLSAGVSPATISGAVHTAEVFSSAASGYSHYKFGNVNKKLFKALVIPGVIGAILGAILLTWLGNADAVWLRAVLACYTMFLGIKFLINAFREQRQQKKFKHYSALAGAGGFLDSFGGGGWGPLVTTTLINKGRSPKYVIGSVSLTEFFVTLASAFTFFTLLGVSHWQVIAALLIGGFVAAPIAAKLTGKMPKKTAYILLGILVIIWSLRILLKAF